MTVPIVRVQEEPFDVSAETVLIKKASKNIGAIVSFTGVCRHEAGKLSHLELEHYPGMAEQKITQYATEAMQRFDLFALSAIHRYGKISAGEDIVLVIAASAHRQAAFDGANFVMDFLKTGAPFWKKEYAQDGTAGAWVDANDKDDGALLKWD